jgi:hypothetical protein
MTLWCPTANTSKLQSGAEIEHTNYVIYESLADISRSLGISEYLGDFITAGFFAWDDLLDITEIER